MTYLLGLIIYGVLAVVLAFVLILQRHFANQTAAWPDDNAKDDEAARRNVLRVLTLGLVAFTLVVAVLMSMQHGWMLSILPLAVISLITVAVVRMRTRSRKASDGDDKSYW